MTMHCDNCGYYSTQFPETEGPYHHEEYCPACGSVDVHEEEEE